MWVSDPLWCDFVVSTYRAGQLAFSNTCWALLLPSPYSWEFQCCSTWRPQRGCDCRVNTWVLTPNNLLLTLYNTGGKKHMAPIWIDLLCKLPASKLRSLWPVPYSLGIVSLHSQKALGSPPAKTQSERGCSSLGKSKSSTILLFCVPWSSS
jgi:hypothetical protein